MWNKIDPKRYIRTDVRKTMAAQYKKKLSPPRT